MKRILVAYDRSEAARRALVRAAELSGPADRVDVVAVLPGDDRSERQAVLAEARAFLEERGLQGDVMVRTGDPAIEICDAAAERRYDLVVLGSRELNALERALLGSVSTWVAEHADCDVVITR